MPQASIMINSISKGLASRCCVAACAIQLVHRPLSRRLTGSVRRDGASAPDRIIWCGFLPFDLNDVGIIMFVPNIADCGNPARGGSRSAGDRRQAARHLRADDLHVAQAVRDVPGRRCASPEAGDFLEEAVAAPRFEPTRLAGDLRGWVLHCPARSSRACNGRPANLLTLQGFIHAFLTENHGVGGSIPPLGTKKLFNVNALKCGFKKCRSRTNKPPAAFESSVAICT
jgi:hypothetical protein